MWGFSANLAFFEQQTADYLDALKISLISLIWRGKKEREKKDFKSKGTEKEVFFRRLVHLATKNTNSVITV